MTERIYRFAQFELSVAESVLKCGPAILPLQQKPLLLLIALLEQPRRLVTREQLRSRMWHSRTVVDYEQGINVAVRKLRDALGDSAENPRFIETVTRKGYRFLLPVEVVSAEAQAVAGPLEADGNAAADPVSGVAPMPAAIVTRPGFGARRLWLSAALAAAILGATGLTLWQGAASPPAPIRSLAVLPLQDLSPDPDQEYFADGITEELTTRLAQALPLRVISRTSVMRFRRSDKPIGQIARELGVDAIVEGSIMRSADRVSVTAQLIDAREDRHLWAEKYERSVADIMAVEAELSQAIAGRISGALVTQRVPDNAARVNPQAHEFVLLGRYHREKRTTADLAKALQYFQQAIALDQGYAPAHAGLADVYALQALRGDIAFSEGSAQATTAARRALRLDASLAEPHATLGLVKLSSREEWSSAAQDFRRALQLNPSYAPARHWHAYYLMLANHLEEACAEIELARQLDPLSAIINTDQGEILNAAHRYAQAETSLRRAMELAPDLGRAHARMTVTALATGRLAEAVQEARVALSLDPMNAATMAHAGYAFAVAGSSADATQLLLKLKDMARRDINVSMYAAMVESGLGRKDEALATLEAQRHAPDGALLQGIRQWYAFQSLRTEPRFRGVLSQP